MNIFEKLLYCLQGDMQTPTLFGWFHLMCIVLCILSLFVLYKLKNKYNNKQLKIVLFTYGFIALILELLKQLIWSFNYDALTNTITWDYQWYAAPFQLCTTPIFICLICAFLNKGKLRDSLLSYISFVTILGSITTLIYPTSCFVPDILVNIHAMWLHLGSFVVSIYLIMNKEVMPNKVNFKNAIITFLVICIIALILNIGIYNSNILNGETFNMFYISPYFISSLPVFDIIQQNTPYIIFLFTYLFALILGAYIVWFISKNIMKVR